VTGQGQLRPPKGLNQPLQGTRCPLRSRTARIELGESPTPSARIDVFQVNSTPEHQSVHVSLGPDSYEILIVSGEMASVAAAAGDWLGGGTHQAFLITDANIADSHAGAVAQSLRSAGWGCDCFTLQPGEQSKSLAVAQQIYDWLVQHQASRNCVVVAVGGGVVGDLAGFVAATYTRGVPFIQVPTTLLAQVDSSVGGKVGVNHERAKNLIGAFYQPRGVYIDTSTVATLPNRDYRSGLAEVIKYGVILDAGFFEFLEGNVDGLNSREPATLRHVIARSCQLKAQIVEQDERETTGLRAVLNYGHTFAHAFEALCGYGDLLHGEAVAIGMKYAAALAERRKQVGTDLLERQTRLLQNVGLPTQLPNSSKLKSDEVIDRMRLDKKSVSGRLRFILPTQLGHVELFDDVDEADVLAVIDELAPR